MGKVIEFDVYPEDSKVMSRKDDSMAEFDKVWAQTGYQYGQEKLDAVKLGWELALKYQSEKAGNTLSRRARLEADPVKSKALAKARARIDEALGIKAAAPWRIAPGIKQGVFVVVRDMKPGFVQYLQSSGKISASPGRFRSKEAAQAVIDVHQARTSV